MWFGVVEMYSTDDYMLALFTVVESWTRGLVDTNSQDNSRCRPRFRNWASVCRSSNRWLVNCLVIHVFPLVFYVEVRARFPTCDIP